VSGARDQTSFGIGATKWGMRKRLKGTQSRARTGGVLSQVDILTGVQLSSVHVSEIEGVAVLDYYQRLSVRYKG